MLWSDPWLLQHQSITIATSCGLRTSTFMLTLTWPGTLCAYSAGVMAHACCTHPHASVLLLLTLSVLQLPHARPVGSPMRQRLMEHLCSVLNGKGGMDSDDRLPAWCDDDRRRK
jgi:hypothetical protein